MKEETVKVVLEVNVPMFVGHLPDESRRYPETVELITLEEYKVVNGTLHWTAIDSRGQRFQGGLLSELPMEYNIKIKPAIPVILHKRWNGLSPEFFITTDSRLSILPLVKVKDNYLPKNENLFQSINKRG